MFCLLKVIDGPSRGAQVLLGRDQRLLIGRISTADFSIANDQHLSRKHLTIEGLGESFRVTDAGSSNGTYVNNTLISTVLLCSGDIIRAGKSLFHVQLKKESEADSQMNWPDISGSEPLPEIPERAISSGLPTSDPTALFSQPSATFQATSVDGSFSGDETTLCTPMDDSSIVLLITSHFSVDDPSATNWRQRSEPSSELNLNILRSLAKLPLSLNLIVNKRQIDSSLMAVIQFQLLPGELTNLTETLCMITTRRENILLALWKAGTGRDAVILVVSPQTPSSRWVEQSLDAVSFPSLLLSIVEEAPARARSLTKNIDFLLVETANRRLCLIPSSEFRDRIHLFLADQASPESH